MQIRWSSELHLVSAVAPVSSCDSLIGALQLWSLESFDQHLQDVVKTQSDIVKRLMRMHLSPR